MFKFTLIPLLWSVVNTQSNRDLYNGQFVNDYQNGEFRRPYNDARDTRLPSPGDSDYRTYVYNNRRYGLDPSRYNNPFNPNINQPGGFPYNPIPYNPLNPNPLDDQYKYNVNRDPNNPDALFPGVLGGWREDLQGKERQNSRQLKRDIFVNTNYGQVQGFKVYLYDNPEPESGYRPWLSPVERIQGEVSVFLGIPYARPPVDEGRFKPPRQHPGWQLLQAVDWGPACPQPVAHTGATKGVRDMDEDCLYLNVFSPTTEAGATAQKYPVMVYIHGGQFQSGASNLFPAHYMAAFYRVVVVSLNYRLGALGFLSTADENSPGNYGILDQAMALRWVYDNIGPFNGDRESITLFGPGAGAASAGILAVAPSTRDIVTRVIAQSGSAVAEWAMVEEQYRAVNTSLTFGRLLGCPIDSCWKLVNCLRHRSFYELGNAHLHGQPWVGYLPWAPVLQREWPLPGNEWYAGWRAADWRLLSGTPWVGYLPWAPVLQREWPLPGDEWYAGWRAADWRLLSGTVEDAIRHRAFNPKLQYMTGVTTQEAAYVLYNNDSLAPRYEITEQWFENKINEFVLRYNYTLNPKGVYNAIKYMYTYHPDPHNKSAIRDQYIHFLSDFLYRAPTDKIVKLLLDHNVPVYMYVLNTTVEAFNWPEWRRYPHDTEHFFLTGAPFMDPEFFPKKYRIERHMWSGNDRNMSHFFMKAFTDFARYGNPTRERILGMHFEMAKPGELRYLNINTTYNSTIQLNYRQTELAFWTVYLPTVIGRVLPTYPPITEYWWEPARPLQIAFWSVSGVCLLLVVALAVLCMLWRNAKRETERYNYSDDIFMVPDAGDTGTETRSQGNIYEYRDVPVKPHTPTPLSRATSAQSRPASAITVTGSALSLSLQAPAPLPRARPPAALPHQVPEGVPQTTV